MSIDPSAVWARMKMRVWPERYWLLALTESTAAAAAEVMLRSTGTYCCLIRDQAGISMVVDEAGSAVADELAHVQARFGPFRIVSTDGELPFDVVGFLRPVLEVLNSAGIKAGPICATGHDHLFIYEKDIEQAEAIIDEFIATSRQESSSLQDDTTDD
ncbi:hypothetical protein [Streptomyces sp. NPDC001508]|uniref:hypothetical protein n=1 Tax=Streptomyces sp. NPDC001508 TaxID=3154656 RepID=UPI003323282E